MIVVMEKAATPEQVKHMAGRVEALGLKAHIIQGTERTVIAAIGDKRDGTKESLASGPGVEEVVPILAPYKVASREVKKDPTQVTVGSLKVGAGVIGIIAGPCSVESEQQIMDTARAVKAAGATALRGGAFKPRTSPYSFQGIQEAGLKLLDEIRASVGLKVVTEAVDERTLELLEPHTDMLQIGARNMQNFSLLRRAGKSRLPVLLKRGPGATLDELLTAADYLLAGGNTQVALCERGIRTFSSHSRYTLDLAAVPALHELSHLPVVVDPSHGAGVRSRVPAMALAAAAAGADAVMVEVHPEPPAARSDGQQSLYPAQFAELLPRLLAVAAAAGRES